MNMAQKVITAPRKYITFKHIALLVVGAIILFLAFSYAGIPGTLNALYIVNPFFLLIFIVSRFAIYFLITYRWKLFVDRLKPIGFFKLLPIFFSGTIADNLVPGPSFGSEPVKAYYLSKAIKRSISRCFATALMEGIAFTIALFGFLAASISYAFLYIDIPIIRSALAIILIALIFLVSIVYYLYSKKSDRLFVDRILTYIYNFRPIKFIRKKFVKYDQFKEAISKHFSDFVLILTDEFDV